MKRAVAALAAIALTSAASARVSLGIFENWGAFRDDRPLRCFAIAEPVRVSKGTWRPFAAVAHWPDRGARNQINIRLSRQLARDAQVTLSIGDRNFTMVAGGADAWAPDARTDAAIVAAMRSGSLMSISGRSVGGSRFTDAYRLRGAATAIDAAALGCARRR